MDALPALHRLPQPPPLGAAAPGEGRRAPGGGGGAALDPAGARRAASELEAVFLRMLLERMLPEDGGGLFGAGPSAGVVRSLFVEGVAASLAERRALGVAALVERELAREAARPSPEGRAARPGVNLDRKG